MPDASATTKTDVGAAATVPAMASPDFPKLRIATLFSGGGSTMQNLIDATRDGRLPNVEVVRAIASRGDVAGMAKATAAGLPLDVVARRDFNDASAHSAAVFERLSSREVDLIVLAGWMCQLDLKEPWLDRRVLNVHPSLLPAFGGRGMFGRRVHEAVLARGCKVTGCTVHWVDNELDGGPIVDQRVVAVEEDDTPETLAARVQAAERLLLVEVIGRIADVTCGVADERM